MSIAWRRSRERSSGVHEPFPEFEPPEASVARPRTLTHETEVEAVSSPAPAPVTSESRATNENRSAMDEPLDVVASVVEVTAAKVQGKAAALSRSDSQRSESAPHPEPMECDLPDPAPATPPRKSWYEMTIEEEEAEAARNAAGAAADQQTQEELPCLVESNAWAQRQIDEDRRLALTLEAEQRAEEERIRQEEERARLRREEAERHAAAAEARLREEALATLPAARAPALPCTGTVARDQPAVSLPEPEPMIVESTPGPSSSSDAGRDTSRGAIPKQRPQKSKNAEAEMDVGTQGEKQLQRVELMVAVMPPVRTLPVTSAPIVSWEEENWDDDEPSQPPPARVSQPNESVWAVTVPPSLPAKAPKKKAKKRGDPDRRQWTTDDYVGRYIRTPPVSPLPGPANLVSREGVRHQDTEQRTGNNPSTQQERRGRHDIRDVQRESVYPVRINGVKFGGLVPIPTDARVDPPPFACFNCWERGHQALL